MENKIANNRFLIFNSLILKLIAIITMTFDHIGIFLESMPNQENLSLIFRIIGRLSLPLFIFLIVEGVEHTKNIYKYILRIAVIGLIVLIGQIILEFALHYSIHFGNIFIDLILCILVIYFLNSKNKYIQLLAFLPFIYGILSFICFAIEFSYDNSLNIWWFPYFLRTQYHFFSLFLALGFFSAKKLYKIMLKRLYPTINIDDDFIKSTKNYQIHLNLLAISSLIIVITCEYLFFMFLDYRYCYIDYKIEMYGMISSAFILLYNGKKGYNSKVIKVIEYIYYPLHLLVLALIFMGL